MTGIDTNVLVRYLVEDDPDQADRVHRWLANCRTTGERVYLSTIVLCEMTWVLQSVFAKSRSEIHDAVAELPNTDVFEVEEPDSVRAASSSPGTARPALPTAGSAS